MRVLALDPGEKVGWARADVAEDGTWSDVRHGITPLRDMALAVHGAMYPEFPSSYDVVVMEDWSLFPEYAKTFIGSRFPAVQFIGAVRLCCWVSNTKLVIQQPAHKKPALAAMKKIDPTLYEKCTRGIKHDDAHDQDALIHLWRYTWLAHDLEVPQAA